ncbi:MAG: 4Fe-4S single cluster domain-containing protein [Promethearchaeia archaeon]
MKIRINDIFEESRANGPGIRFVIFMQGCPLRCEGCINPQTHDPNGGYLITIKKLVNKIKLIRNKLEGITITGGEPFFQPKALYKLVKKIKTLNLSIIISTGYEIEELRNEINYFNKIISNIDVLIYGRFHHEQILGSGLVGSKNKRIIFFTNKYCIENIYNTPKFEIQIFNNKIKASGTNLYNLFDWKEY